MKLKVYADRMSQPSRAVIIFCKVNGIDYEEIKVLISKGQHLTSEFAEINPMKRLPAIVDGGFKLFERYPADVAKRSRIHSVLDWHHSNLRRGADTYVSNATIAHVAGRPLTPQAAAETETLLLSSLSKLESFWLKDDGCFLLGGNQPSIADLSLVCEIMELEVLDEKDRARLLGPHKKVLQWIESTRNATNPHFDEVHQVLMKVKERLQYQRLKAAKSEGGSDMKKPLLSRM
ncbi:glutathione S-transferase T1-like isoform X2 [Hibiscus syriacus]|uniref:glutathione S-transferase T1-like isoform X2 n=1 Tax=Hibiscus syriacus TaxID=106335 RepID=UPI0019226B83|nr:glutathione S-transferase T1-like isoform X2 [Hibiscus syriacus]